MCKRNIRLKMCMMSLIFKRSTLICYVYHNNILFSLSHARMDSEKCFCNVCVINRKEQKQAFYCYLNSTFRIITWKECDVCSLGSSRAQPCMGMTKYFSSW